MGIGIAGLIDKEGNIKASPNIPVIVGKNIKDLIPEIKVPWTYGNDATLFTAGEWLFGEAKGKSNVVGITLGTGVGGGIVVDNFLVEGKNGYAGEIGHTIIDPEGPQCRCGKRGCLESFIGGDYMTERARLMYEKEGRTFEKLNPEILHKLAKKGDRIARKIFEEFSFYLALGIANMVEVFDPDTVVLGGGLTYASDVFFENTIKFLKEITSGRTSFEVKISKSKDMAGIIGAMAYFLYKYG